MSRWLLALPLAALFALVVSAVPPTQPGDKPDAKQAEALDAAKRVQVAKGLSVSLWASEPQLANPVSFAFDHQGKCFVAETTRFGNGVPDTRGYMQWIDDDIGARSVDDRLAMYKKFKYEGYEQFNDSVRRVWDSTGAGKADKSTVFSTGYNQLKDGLGSGVLARDGGVYYTCIPDVYLLKDKDGDGVADSKESLSTGYGVRAQFLGHDLHGLRVGPDGKLYFSIGDRGFKVTTKEGKLLHNPDSGAVLRCDLDGANLEIVHTGLRNPQELAFDDFGNLFTWDNNSDSGDRARWVQIVEGGDSGWRCGYQYGTLMHHAGVPQGNRGPWNTEKIWHEPSADSVPPAYVVPALKHFGNGPSGLTHYPGVGLSDRYAGHFFACDFTASANNSQVWSFAVKPKGASFEVTDLHPFAKTCVPTDCEFGPDGAFYILDWVGGWSPPGKGRIFKVTDAEAMKKPAVAEAKALLAEGFTTKTPAELIRLLGHPHREVRQEAQFAVAAMGGPALETLRDYATTTQDRLGRLHAIWAMEQAMTKAMAPAIGGPGGPGGGGAGIAVPIGFEVPYAVFAASPDSEVRAQIARSNRAPREVLLKLLADADLRVRSLAALGVGRAYAPVPEAAPTAVAKLLALLVENADKDVYLRHACAHSLATMMGHNPTDLVKILRADPAASASASARLGVVLALRKLKSDELAEFVTDAEPAIVAEAARAIYDLEIMPAMPALAAQADKPNLPEAVAYRAAAANYKLGTTEAAARVVAVAARVGEAEPIREAALKLLGEWAKPGRRDPITGLTQSIEARDPAPVKAAVVAQLAKLFVGSNAIRSEAAALTAKLGVAEVGPLMAALVTDAKQPASLRVEALFALEAVKAKQLGESANAALASDEPRLRAAARVVAAKVDPKAALEALPKLVADDAATIVERQMALTVLGTLPESTAVDQALNATLDRALSGKLPAELKLEALEAAGARATAKNLKLHANLREKLKAVDIADRAAEAKDPLARWRDAIAGGDAVKGQQVFLNSAAVYCQRCHKVDAQGGEVGPVLNGIGAKHPREYLLEAIVYPNAKIAEGYQSVIINTADGASVSGVLRGKDATMTTLVTPENKVISIKNADIDDTRPDKSAMPEDLHKKMTRRELRDLVEFLASLKTTSPAPGKGQP